MTILKSELATPDTPEPTLIFSPRQFVRIGGALLCLDLPYELRLGRPMCGKALPFRWGHSKAKALPDQRGVAANSKGFATESRRLSAHRTAKPQRAIRDYGLEIDNGYMASPPSTWITCPVIYRASSDSRKQAMRATSSGSAKRASGICSKIFAR